MKRGYVSEKEVLVMLTGILREDNIGSITLQKMFNLSEVVAQLAMMVANGSSKQSKRLQRKKIFNRVRQNLKKYGKHKKSLDQQVSAKNMLGVDVTKDLHQIPIWSDKYPESLLALPDPPILLYVLGQPDLLNNLGVGGRVGSGVGVVGSRAMSSYGSRATRALLRVLDDLDVVVVSGLAKGIDSAAHEIALENDIKTVGVVPGSLDSVYVKHARELGKQIVRHGGALVSEFPCGRREFKGMFPMRNRLIAGLSKLVLIIEAGERSGALNTASHVAELGRELFVVPGNIFARNSRGCNRLISEGAQMVLSPKEFNRQVKELLR